MSKMVDITGQTFGHLTALEYVGDRNWKCQCDCGKTILANSYYLRKGATKSCGHDRKNKFKDLTGQTFGEWEVLEYLGESYWKCQCSCGEIREVHSAELRNGNSKSCGHNTSKFKDLTGKQFGEYKVLKYLGKRKWECQCSCGAIKSVHGYDLASGHSKSCGHSTNRFKDLTNMKFGYLTPIKYIGQYYWECECDCGTIINVRGEHLRNGLIRSCGCKKTEMLKQTLMDKYGELRPDKERYRTAEQINTLHNKEKLRQRCIELKEELDRLPYTYEIAEDLYVNSCTILKKLHLYNLEEYVNIDKKCSNAEIEISKLFKNCVLRDTKQLSKYNLELDVYIPNTRKAIEFNGSYWHSIIFKDMYYHQKKTLAAMKEDIHLIHIFEYEWNNNKDKILNFISDNKTEINTEDMDIEIIDKDICKEFIDKYHIHKYEDADIHIGYMKQSELYGVCTFKKYDNNMFELLQYSCLEGIEIKDGEKTIVQYFLDNYNPKSIELKLDISKFNPKRYLDIGFKPIEGSWVTQPNYVWVDTKDNDVLNSKQVNSIEMFKRHITENYTEDEVMSDFDYIKIYDSGKMLLKLEN